MTASMSHVSIILRYKDRQMHRHTDIQIDTCLLWCCYFRIQNWTMPFPKPMAKKINGTFTVLRCTVGIRCFTVSVYFLLQINFFKSIFWFIFLTYLAFRYFMKILRPILVLPYAIVNLNSFRNMFAFFGFNLVLPSSLSNVAISYDLLCNLPFP